MHIEKDVLEQLYVKENKTDKEIAEKFGVNHFNISALRAKYGIKGIHARHRKLFDKPQLPLTLRQKSILFGSLLGDSCLKSRNDTTAYLSISHSIKQKAYIDWLYEEFKTICNRFPQEYVSKGKYTTYELCSESRVDIKEIKNKIYVPNKRISQWWLDQINDLSLAIWYMDDGCLSYVNKTKMIFSFATNSFTMEENYALSEMLKIKFNISSEIKPISRRAGVQYNLIISDCSFKNFEDTISKYIVSDLSYKLPGNIYWEKLKSNLDGNITKEIISEMYNEMNLTQEQIADTLGVHKSTVSKYMNVFDIYPRNQNKAQLSGKNNHCGRLKNGTFVSLELEGLTEEEKEISKNIFLDLRARGFPYVEKKSDEHYIGILDAMMGEDICKIENEIFNYSRSGMEICTSICPQIFSMAANGSKSPIEIFGNDIMLLDCIKRTIKYAKKNSIAAIRQGLKTYRQNRCVTVFPPMWAKTAIKGFCNGNSLSVLDFSCGFGGRLIGCYTSGMVKKYVGIDPVEKNIISHKEINRLIGIHSSMRKFDFKSEFIQGCAEKFLTEIDDCFDIVITSPPYFSKEVYSINDDQCYVKYPYYNLWKDQWLKNVLNLSYNKLNLGGKMIIFASNYDKYSLGNDCRDLLSEIGGKNVKCLRFSIPSLEYFRSKGIKKCDTAWVIEK